MSMRPAAPLVVARSLVKVYLEDTDAQGVVYHANYLKYFERARSDFLEQRGVGLKGAQDLGYRFVVHALKLQYHRPAMLGDRLVIETAIHRASEFRLVFDQRALREGEDRAVTKGEVEVVCIDRFGDLCEIRDELVGLGP